MEEDDKEDDDKGHQHQVKEKEEVEKHLLKKSQAEHLLHQEDKRRQEREAPQDKWHGETEAEERRLRQSQAEHLLRQVEKQHKETKEAAKIQDKQQQTQDELLALLLQERQKSKSAIGRRAASGTNTLVSGPTADATPAGETGTAPVAAEGS
jgi:hypothetical protein